MSYALGFISIGLAVYVGGAEISFDTILTLLGSGVCMFAALALDE